MTPIYNGHAIAALERTRDLLCAFHRDFPTRYPEAAKQVLREGLAVIETAKQTAAKPESALDLLEEWITGGECFCSEGVAARGPCTFCKTIAFLRQKQEVTP